MMTLPHVMPEITVMQSALDAKLRKFMPSQAIHATPVGHCAIASVSPAVSGFLVGIQRIKRRQCVQAGQYVNDFPCHQMKTATDAT